MNENHEKFRKWLELAKQVRPNSPFTYRAQLTDAYLENQIGRGQDGYYWMYIGKETKDDCKKTNNPNLWFKVRDDGTITMGVAFNNNKSVLLAQNLLEGHSEPLKGELLAHLNTNMGWRATIEMRKKYHTFGDTPEYDDKGGISISEMDDDKIKTIFLKAEAIIEEYRERVKLPKDNPEHLVHGGGAAFDLIWKNFPATEEEFKQAFAYAHDALIICLKVKTPAQHRKEQRDKEEKSYFPSCLLPPSMRDKRR